MAITGYKSEGVPASRIDLAAFQAWADWCIDISEGAAPTPIPLESHIYFDTAFSLRKALDMVSLNGRGTIVQLGSKFTVIIDKVEEIAVQRFLFTMGNIKKDSFAEEFLPMGDRANAVAITYFDREMDYIRQTVEVYSDDFDTSDKEINKTSIILYGCTSRYQATDHGSFLIKCNRYVTVTVSFDADVDAIACRPGDIIDVAHDVPNWGQSGRVVSATVNTITLDKEVAIDSSFQYMVGIKHIDDDSREEIEVDAATMGTGNYSVLQILTNWVKTPASNALYYFGKIDQLTKAVRILRISRSSDQRRKLSGVEYVPEVYTRSGSVVTPVLPAAQSQACVGLSATEIWSGGTISSVSLLWRGFALTWYVYRSSGVSWILLGTTNGLNYTDSGLSYGMNYTFSVSPTANPNDANADQVTVNVSGANVKIEVVDSIGMVDGTIKVQNYNRRIMELLEADDYGKGGTHKRRLSESIGITDAIIKVQNYNRRISESPGVLDSSVSGFVLFIVTSDIAGVTDSLAIKIIQGRIISESLGIPDSLVSGLVPSTVVGDSIGVSDSLAIVII